MPVPTTLWRSTFKVNTDEGGFSFSLHVVNNDEAVARTVFNDIASRYKILMPKSAEIFYASMTKWDSKRDGRYLHLAVGPGEYVEAVGPPILSDYDFSKTCLNIRLENNNGGMATLKFNPIPDKIVYGGAVVAAIPPVIGVPVGDPPAPGAGADWYAEFTNFMAAIVKFCAHIESGGLPGADYTSRTYVNAFAARVSAKKGGRVFI